MMLYVTSEGTQGTPAIEGKALVLPCRSLRRGARMTCIAAGLSIAALVTGCSSLPPLNDRPATYALQPSADSPIGRTVLPQAQEHPGLTGVLPISDGRIAFGVRPRWCARPHAQSTSRPSSGTPMPPGRYCSKKCCAPPGAACARLLLDDLNTAGTDPTLALWRRTQTSS
jgi:putative cardiolipin synthase